MNKQEWMEYFEALNSRLPNQDEIQAALANGDFIEEVTEVAAETVAPEMATEEAVVEAVAPEVAVEAVVPEEAVQVAPAPETAPVSQEAPVASQVQEAPAQPSQSVVPPVAPSQTTQGQAAQQQQYQVPPQPQQPGKFQIMARDFWTWFVSALKAPSTLSDTRPMNGYIASGFLSFFYALTLFFLARYSFSQYTTYYKVPSNPDYNPVGFQSFLVFCLISVLLVSAVILAGFVVKRVILRHTSCDFAQTVEWFGRHLAINLLLMAAAFLFALLGLATFASYLLFASMVLLGAVSTFNIARSLEASNMDIFYRYLLAIVVNGLIIAAFAYIASSLATSYYTSSFF